MTTKHTPGPWEIDFQGNVTGQSHAYGLIGGVAKFGIAEIQATRTTEEKAANARLIAAAPEMLDALKLALRLVRHPTSAEMEIRNAIVAAIAKAEGGAA